MTITNAAMFSIPQARLHIESANVGATPTRELQSHLQRAHLCFTSRQTLTQRAHVYSAGANASSLDAYTSTSNDSHFCRMRRCIKILVNFFRQDVIICTLAGTRSHLWRPHFLTCAYATSPCTCSTTHPLFRKTLFPKLCFLQSSQPPRVQAPQEEGKRRKTRGQKTAGCTKQLKAKKLILDCHCSSIDNSRNRIVETSNISCVVAVHMWLQL